MSFDIHKVKRIIKLYDEDQVNDFLKDDWVLLHVGQETEDGNHAIVFTLGSLRVEDTKEGDGFDNF